MTILNRLLTWLFPRTKHALRASLNNARETAVTRLHIPRSMMNALRRATRATPTFPEPLVLLEVRFASEQTRNTVVAVAAQAFPIEAYVDGFAGANFDTSWLVDAANAAMRRNSGVFLVHSHGGVGIPRFSSVDDRTNRNVIAPLARGVTTVPYGAMVLSESSAFAVIGGAARRDEVHIVEVPDQLGSFEVTT